jgi:hypothetical protein
MTESVVADVVNWTAGGLTVFTVASYFSEFLGYLEYE